MDTNKLVTKLEEKVFSLIDNLDEETNPWSPDQTATAIGTLLYNMKELQERNDYKAN